MFSVLSVSWQLCTLLLKAFGCSGLLPRRVGAVEMGTKWYLFESFSLWHWPFCIYITNCTLLFFLLHNNPCLLTTQRVNKGLPLMITLRNQSDSLLNHFYEQVIFSPIIINIFPVLFRQLLLLKLVCFSGQCCQSCPSPSHPHLQCVMDLSQVAFLLVTFRTA